MESNGNRTPSLGLRYTTDALLNQNWDTLDHTIANAFQPDSPIQFPESFYVPENSVVKQAFYPGESIYAYSEQQFAVEGICLLAQPYQAFSMTPMNSVGGRGGYWFSFGTVVLSLHNLTASAVAADVKVDLYAYGTSRTIVPRCPMILPPSSKLPMLVPLSARGGAPFPPPGGDWSVKCEVMKTAGADTSLTVRVEGGTLAVVEMP
jgi:hypothetical protein